MHSSQAVRLAAGRDLARRWVEELKADVTRLGNRIAELNACETLEGFTTLDCATMRAQLECARGAAEQAMYRAGARTLELSPEDKAEALDAIARN